MYSVLSFVTELYICSKWA